MQAIKLADMLEREIAEGKRSAGLRRMWRGVLVEEHGTAIHLTYLTESGGLLDITLGVRVMSL